MSRVPLAVAFATLALTILVPASALANSAPTRWIPDSGGLVVPTTTSDVKIDRELLTFDLATGEGTATVRASYDLVNVSGREVDLDAIFIGPGATGMSITMSGAPMAVNMLDQTKVKLPNQWLYPMSYFDMDKNKVMGGVAAGQGDPGLGVFKLHMAAGETGTLVATYSAQLGYSRTNGDKMLAYVLGPADSWAGFGILTVKVTVPAGYTIGSQPALARTGEAEGKATYEGEFSGIPAEMMLVTARPSGATSTSDPAAIAATAGASPLYLVALIGPLAIALLFGVALAAAVSGRRMLIAIGVDLLIAPAVTAALGIVLVVVLILLAGSSFPDQNLALGLAILWDPLAAAVAGFLTTLVLGRLRRIKAVSNARR